jgi:small nuclear ribonucleoprotein
MSDASTAELLNESLGNVVLVKLKGGRDLRGVLRSFDQHLNIVLEEADELKEGTDPRKLGTIIVRGDSVIIISPAPR